MDESEREPEEEPERSRTAGACVLVVLVALVVAVVFALSPTAGVLAVWLAGAVLLWRAARRRMSGSSATPPPGEDRPSCHECAGHELLSVTPLESQKGMLIYKTAPPDRPHHTHVHLAREAP